MKSLQSTVQIPFELKMKDDYRYYAVPSPQKHDCSGQKHSRSLTMESPPRKYESKFLNMDYYLPRDYKVFDVNLNISPLFAEPEQACQD